MNKAIVAAVVGVLGLALGLGAGWLWDSMTGDSASVESTTPTPSP